MSKFRNGAKSIDIFDYLCEWKAQYSEVLYEEMFKGHCKERTFWKTVRSLESEGMLSHIRAGKPPRKILYISKEASTTHFSHKKLCIEDIRIYHEARVSLYSSFLMNKIACSSFNLSHQNDSKGFASTGIDPDCILNTYSGKKIALEIELTQKSRPRVYKKFEAYSNSSYDYYVYIFNSKTIANNYVQRIKEFLEILTDREGGDSAKSDFLSKLILINHKDYEGIDLSENNFTIQFNQSKTDMNNLITTLK